MKSSREENYWRRKLHFDHPRAIIPFEFESKDGFSDGLYEFELGKEKVRLLNEFTGGDNLKLQIVLLATTGLLLNRYSQLNLIRFGTPADKQQGEAPGDTVIIPLELDVSDGTTFRELLNQTRDALVDGVFHQNFDFRSVEERFTYQDEHPLYDVICLLTNVQDLPEHSRLSSNLIFGFVAGKAQVKCRTRFNNSRYSTLFIKDIAKNFSEYLNAALTNMDKPVEQILAPEQQKAIEPVPSLALSDSEMFVERFGVMARLHPDKTAVVQDGRSVNYWELDERSSRLAHYLLDFMEDPDGCIALYMDNSIETVISLLAILKSGFAFVPLDTTLPQKRVWHILEDSRSAVVFTSGAAGHALPTGVRIVDVSDLSLFGQYSNNDPALRIAAGKASYIIYTSGTSGTPKGVVIPHSAFMNYINWAATQYTNNGQKLASFPLFSSISFDLTITSIFVPLICGGTIIVYAQDQPDAVIESMLRGNRIGVLKITPSHLRLLIDVIKREVSADFSDSKLHTLIVGGEAFNTRLADEFQKYFPSTDIYNEYGPTEATVGCMIHKFGLQDKKYATVPIGLPIDNASIALLDDNGLQVPAGAVGEIFIGGPCLSLGYLNNEALSNSRFVFLQAGHANRFYKTGDLAKRLSNGSYLYIGRKDSQVKVSGYRIELEEIEHCARRCPGINEASVVCKTAGTTLRIVLYFTSDTVGETDLRLFLADWLPGYMLPNQIIQLKWIPLTVNGKLDTKNLLALGDAGKMNIALPNTPTEKELYKIWMKYLEVDDLGINDSFYASGGDSIKSLGVMNDINKLFRIRLQVKDLYALKTIRNMADYIDKTGPSDMVSNKEQVTDKELIMEEISKLKSGILDKM